MKQYIVIKLTIYISLTKRCIHTTFENNWPSSYQEEVKNVQLLMGDDTQQGQTTTDG